MCCARTRRSTTSVGCALNVGPIHVFAHGEQRPNLDTPRAQPLHKRLREAADHLAAEKDAQKIAAMHMPDGCVQAHRHASGGHSLAALESEEPSLQKCLPAPFGQRFAGRVEPERCGLLRFRHCR